MTDLEPAQLRSVATILDNLRLSFPSGQDQAWTSGQLRWVADQIDAARGEDPARDEAIIACRSILGLLRHRGLVDTEQNRLDVEDALYKIHPYSDEAERRVMKARGG